MGTHFPENGRVGWQKEDSCVDLREEMEGNCTPATSNSPNVTIFARARVKARDKARAFSFKRRGLLRELGIKIWVGKRGFWGHLGHFGHQGLIKDGSFFLSGDTGVCWFYFLMFSFHLVLYSFLGPSFFLPFFFFFYISLTSIRFNFIFLSSKGGLFIFLCIIYFFFSLDPSIPFLSFSVTMSIFSRNKNWASCARTYSLHKHNHIS